MQRLSVVVIVIAGLLLAAAGVTAPAPGSAPPVSALLALARPMPKPLRLVSSSDPKGGNVDYVVVQPRQTAEFAKLAGPLTVYRLWFTADPVEQMSVSAVVDGRTVSLRKHGAFDGFPKQPGLAEAQEKSYYSYVPLVALKAFKLSATNPTARPAKLFYQVNYREGATPLHTTSGLAALGQSETQLPPNARVSKGDALAFEGPGSGVVEGVHIHAETSDIALLNRRNLEIQVDSLPLVRIPLGALAGLFYSPAAVRSAGVCARSGNGKTDILLRLPIPYSKSMSLAVPLEGTRRIRMELRIQHAPLPLDALPPYRLHARYVRLKSVRGKPLDLLDVRGQGNFVGLTFACAGTFQRNFAMLEGDETIEVDDNPGLTLKGTGTEDTFNSSWYFPDKPFSRTFHGLTHKSTPPARVSAYRWFFSDRIPFRKHLRFLLEHGGRNNTDGVEYQAVMFWYQR